MQIDSIGAAVQFRPGPARGSDDSDDSRSVDEALRQQKEVNQSKEASRNEADQSAQRSSQIQEDSETGSTERSESGSDPGPGLGDRLDLSI